MVYVYAHTKFDKYTVAKFQLASILTRPNVFEYHFHNSYSYLINTSAANKIRNIFSEIQTFNNLCCKTQVFNIGICV